VPAAKDTVTDIVQGVMDALRNGLDIALFGEVRNSRSRRDSGRTYVSYDRYSSRDRDDRRDRDRRDRDRRDDKKDDRRDDSSRNRRSHRFEDIVFETKGDAVDVRDTLINTIEQYGQATVANFYDLVGITEEYTDHDYGWTNLASSSISMVRGGGWVVNLPKPILLD
jgi:hypothetical protein